jgi:hypothetical protein
MSQNFKIRNGLDIHGIQVIAANGTITGPAVSQITNIVSSNPDTWVRDAANSAYGQANTATTNAATADQKAVTSGVYANSAYSQANTATTDAATADQKAVSAGSYANSAYVQANTAAASAVTSGSFANSAYLQANIATTNAATADQRAVTSGLFANSAYLQANISTTNAATADQRAVTSGVYANAAYDQANTGTILAQAAFNTANSAGDAWARNTANSAYAQANTATTNAATADQKAVSAGSYANSAFGSANTKLSTSGGTISGDLTVTGNLNITGNVTSHSSDDFIVDDPIVLFANNNIGNIIDIGFTAHYIENSTLKHTGLIKDVSENKYYLFDNYEPHLQDNNIINPLDSSFRFATLSANIETSVISVRGYDPINHANSAYTSSNTANQRAVTSGSYANSAYSQANTGTILAQAAFNTANSAGGADTWARNQANGAFNQANTATTNAATADQRAVTSGSFANSAYSQANTALTNAATADQRAVTSGSFANSAYAQANTASVNAISAGSYANSAFARANTSLTSVPNSSTQVSSLGVGTAASGTTGEIRATNNITAYFSSDRTLKQNIQDVTNALDIVCAIGSKTFDWTDAYLEAHGGEDGYFMQKSDFGVIAQDVQDVFPQAVRTREDGTLAVDYEKLAVLSFGAIKELVKRIEVLEAK